MEIKDLTPKQGNVDIVVEVTEVGEVREFQKFGNSGRVANAKVKDATGEVTLTLWNDQIDQIKKGDKLHINNGYVNEWQGEKQLTTGRFGTLEVLGDTAGEEPKVTEDKKEEKKTDEIEEITADDEPEIKEEKIE